MFQRIAAARVDRYADAQVRRAAPQPDHHAAHAIGRTTQVAQLHAQGQHRQLGPADQSLIAIELAKREIAAVRSTLLPALIKALRSKAPALERQMAISNAAMQVRYMLMRANQQVFALEMGATYTDPMIVQLRKEITVLAARAARLGVYKDREHLIPRGHEEPTKKPDTVYIKQALPSRATMASKLTRGGAPTLTSGVNRPPTSAPVRARGTTPPATRAPVQRKASGESATVSNPHDVAKYGVNKASSALPFKDVIQKAFGRHDVSTIRVQIGGAARDASVAIGARAYATGDMIAFAEQPDLHTAAHEAAHVIQQRNGAGPSDGLDRPGDEHERHADRVADLVVAGASAEAALDELVGSEGSRRSSVQRKKDGDSVFDVVANASAEARASSEQDAPTARRASSDAVEKYLLANQTNVWRRIRDHFDNVILPTPHERLTWLHSELFHSQLLEQLYNHAGNFTPLARLDEMLVPSTASKELGTIVPSTKEWSIGVGIALAQALHIAVVASIQRVAVRYLQVADSRGNAGPNAVQFADIVSSMPLDRYVAAALCTKDVVTVEPLDATSAKAAKGKQAGLRTITKITLEGERDPNLWNWVRVEPADATAEEVAAELWRVTDQYGDKTASFNAYLLASAPPLFGIPKRMAIQMPQFRVLAAKAFVGNVGAVVGTDSVDAQLVQVANSSAVDTVAHETPVANAKIQNAPPELAQVQELLRDCSLQLEFVKAKVSPWGFAREIAGAAAFVMRQQTDAPNAAAKKLGDVATVVAGQKSRLTRIAGAIDRLDSASRQLGASNPKSEDAAPVREIFELLAVAAGTSHIASACEPKLDQAMQLQTTLSVRALQSSERSMMGAIESVHQQSGDNRTTGNLSQEAVALQEQSRTLQAQLLDGQNVDAEQLEDVSIRSEHVAFESRLYGTLTALKQLNEAASAAGKGDAAIVASHLDSMSVGGHFLFSGKFRGFPALTKHIADEIHPLLGRLKTRFRAVDDELKSGVSSSSRKASLREDRRKSLADAQSEFEKISKERDLEHFFKEAATTIKDQQLKTAVVRAAAFIGISVVAGAVAELAASSMSSMLMDAAGATEVADLSVTARATIGAARVATSAVVDSTVNAAGQSALTGQKFSDAFEQNLIMTLASSAVFGSMARYAAKEEELTRVEDELLQTFSQKQFGKLAKLGKKLGTAGRFLKSAGAIGVHTVWMAAVNEVAGRITTGKYQPSSTTIHEWAIQGASVALGREISTGIRTNEKLYKDIDDAIGPKTSLAQKAARLQQLADKVAASKSPELTLELLAQHEAFMREQITALERAIAKTGDPTGELALQQSAVEVALRENGSAEMLDTKLALSGLEELVPGALWKGTPDEIQRAIEQAGPAAKVTPPSEGSKRWTIETEGRRIQIEEVADRTSSAAKGATSPVESQGETGKVVDAKTQTELGRIRALQPAGKIRSKADLSDADVALSMNAQLDKIQPGEIDAIVGKYPAEQQARARTVLARSSGFGKMESLNDLRAAIQPHLQNGKLYTPGHGSLADNIVYLAKTKTFDKTVPGSNGIPPLTKVIEPRTIVVLDDVVLAKIKSDPGFAKSLVDNKAVLLEPRGFVDGNNMYNAATRAVIEQRTKSILARSTELQKADATLPFDEAVTRALDEKTQQTLDGTGLGTQLKAQLRVVDPAEHADVTSSAAVAEQLNGEAGITEQGVAAVLSHFNEADAALIREMLSHQAEIFSTRRQTAALTAQAKNMYDIALKRGVPKNEVYYFIYEEPKSYGMLSMAHRQITGTAPDHYLNGPAELADYLRNGTMTAKSMLVVLDDVAGSGDSLSRATDAATRAGFHGEIVISPMVSTEEAFELFNGTATKQGITQRQRNVTFAPERVMQALKESEWYKSLAPASQSRLRALLNHGGFGLKDDFGNGLSMAFPYMGPDNNNAYFADNVAKDFIVNKNQNASKNIGKTWSKP